MRKKPGKTRENPNKCSLFFVGKRLGIRHIIQKYIGGSMRFLDTESRKVSQLCIDISALYFIIELKYQNNAYTQEEND